MLKIVKNPEFTARVKVQVPGEGSPVEQSFIARFRTISVSEGEAFNGFTTEGQTEWLRRIFIGWENGVKDEDGNDVPYSEAARDEMIDVPFIRNAISAAYNAAMLGAKRGN